MKALVLSMAVFLAAQAGWFVVNRDGQPVAGPFETYQECDRLAVRLAKSSPKTISTVCEHLAVWFPL